MFRGDKKGIPNPAMQIAVPSSFAGHTLISSATGGIHEKGAVGDTCSAALYAGVGSIIDCQAAVIQIGLVRGLPRPSRTLCAPIMEWMDNPNPHEPTPESSSFFV